MDNSAIRNQWRLEDMFVSDEEWEAAFSRLDSYKDGLAAFDGKLSHKESVLACLRLSDEFGGWAEKLAVYASARRDEDTRAEIANARYNRVVSKLTEIEERTAFVEPQLVSNSDDVLARWASDPEFADYDYMLRRLIAQKPYILSEKEERILAMTHDFSGDFDTVFTMIDNADLDKPIIEIDGKSVTVTHGVYSKLLQDPRQSVRETAFNAYYSAYEKLKNTLAANYYAAVKKNLFYASARGYDNYLQKCLLAEDVPQSVYTALIESVRSGLPLIHDYVRYRKQAMGLDKLYMYDLYAPIVKDAEMSVDYERACELVLAAVQPLGDDYTATVKEAMENRWIDVYERDGKRSGGYCTHAYLAPHPYILLNYSRTTHDIFTLAHELGHAMHSYYSAHAQPAAKADYKIFVAEVASTVNEMLLLEYLLKQTKDVGVKKFLLSYRLDTIRTTIFRQTMFSEFELEAHRCVERNAPLTVENLSARYEKLNAEYYGDGVERDGHIRYEWMRIPHFYYSFYVYKYATGLTAAVDIARRILSGEEGFIERYRAFLSAGGSKSPYEILCNAGVDLATPAPYDSVNAMLKDTLEQLKQL